MNLDPPGMYGWTYISGCVHDANSSCASRSKRCANLWKKRNWIGACDVEGNVRDVICSVK